eukprot:TRINITY_DN18223_c0_g1_i1.p1 TRINITY_DN18223_c0_g1~~TRINITY_DN18223_c0_g1_i1.p1  ORF type:complete len:266 (-),score=36.82 TRINITY_DN18223_c0_g1_i1:178-975(-)
MVSGLRAQAPGAVSVALQGSDCWKCQSKRPNRSAKERRAQYARASARSVQNLLRSFCALVHRGCQPTRIGIALVGALQKSSSQSKAPPTGNSTPRGQDFGELRSLFRRMQLLLSSLDRRALELVYAMEHVTSYLAAISVEEGPVGKQRPCDAEVQQHEELEVDVSRPGPASEGRTDVFQKPRAIALGTRDHQGRVVSCRVSRFRKLGSFMQAYFQKGPGQGELASQMQFMVKGVPINENDTAEKIGLEDGAIIDVILKENVCSHR